MRDPVRILLLCGGVGGAKLARGFELLDDSVEMTVVVNVGDDFEHLGLHISPDIDTVLYTLSGQANKKQGWGLEGESFIALERLKALGGEAWFQLGDLDLATHLLRTHMLRSGKTLSEITEYLRERLGIRSKVVPATDQKLRTQLETDSGTLDFQHYFVKKQCSPRVSEIRVVGVESATMQASLTTMPANGFDAVVLAPSNPFLSLAPILVIPGMIDRLRELSSKTIAVSPLVGGKALKGPAEKLMRELGFGATTGSWAELLRTNYPDLVTHWVLDTSDEHEAEALREGGAAVITEEIVMRDDSAKARLAESLIERGVLDA